MDVTINGKGPYHFILDTGASLTVIADDLRDELGLAATSEAAGPGGILGQLVRIDALGIGEASLKGSKGYRRTAVPLAFLPNPYCLGGYVCRIARRIRCSFPDGANRMVTPSARTEAYALRESKTMVSIKVKGTPESCESLCHSCSRGHIIRGFRATELEVFCRTFYIEREIPFPVRECTFYEDRRLASKEDMQDIAWNLRSTTARPTPRLGFANAERETDSSENQELLPVASKESKPQE